MIVVADTSVLLNLTRVGRSDLLPTLFGEVVIPPEVADEFGWQAQMNPRFAGLTLPAWLRTQRATSIPEWVGAAAGLDRGESMALALAAELKADAVLMDEEAGRAAAEQHGLRAIGILGILIDAKRLGHLDRVAPVLDALRTEAGFWVSDALHRRILQVAGESPSS